MRLFFALPTFLLFSPATAQFGVAGNRKKAASFQELNEQAKKMQQGGDIPDLSAMGLGDLEKMFGELDPAAMKELADLGPQFDEVMKLIGEMSPEELQKQMQEAMNMMASDDVLSNMMAHQDEVIASLEEMGQIDAEELSKFKKDPEYFQQKMKEGIEQMKDLFGNEDMMRLATESMQGLTDLYNNPDKMVSLMESLFEDLGNDEKIEETRQLLLKNPDLGHPSLSAVFDSEEMKEILNDPVKWRQSVKEGQGLLQNAGAGDEL